MKPERIAKVIARAGICSRRQAEILIVEGRVFVDGKRIDTPALTVTAENVVTVDGKPLKSEQSRLWLFHKPVGCITTHYDPEGRPTVFSLLPKDLPRVISVGRLDYNSEGLLLLTNDGELARKLEHPSAGLVREYRVRAYGEPSAKRMVQIQKGVTIEGMRYAPAKIQLNKEQRGNAWYTVSLTEGKNREIRKLFEYVGLTVNRLIRVAYGPYRLGDLGVGQVKESGFRSQESGK